MAFCELKYYSPALMKATAANILLPNNVVAERYPVLYLLHGLSDDHTAWCRQTSIERYVENLPLIVVMPDSGRGFYCDAQQGMAYETAIVRDLIGFVDRMFPTQPTREGRYVAGLSMGGYGAVKFALKHPDIFSAAVSHSGALAFGHFPLVPDPEKPFNTEFARVVGEQPAGSDNDLFALAERIPVEKRPMLRIDCGGEDFLLESNRSFHTHLEALGYPHEYEEFSGDHNWGYWDVHIQEALQFFQKVQAAEAV